MRQSQWAATVGWLAVRERRAHLDDDLLPLALARQVVDGAGAGELALALGRQHVRRHLPRHAHTHRRGTRQRTCSMSAAAEERRASVSRTGFELR